jgi:hypothetical protein
LKENKRVEARCLLGLLALFLLMVPSSMVFSVHVQPAASELEEFIMDQQIPCGECHRSQLGEWEMSAHANAFNDPVFQESWKAQGEPDACLECHTSISMSPDEWNASQGVSCEMCHGTALTMSEEVRPEDCGACHSYTHFPTYSEWLDSKHGHEGTNCMDCHELPSLTFKYDDPNQLCFDCHQNTTQLWQQGDHGSSEETCVDCHLMRFMSPVERIDHDVTGHSLFPGVPDSSCESCHDEPIEGHMEWRVGPQGCLTCHHETYMTKLHLGNGTIISVSEASVLCGQCHEKIYNEWKQSLHGSVHEDKSCIACHIPWEPYVTWNETLPGIPFTAPTTANQVLMSFVSSPPLPVYMFLGTLMILIGAVFVNRRIRNG